MVSVTITQPHSQTLHANNTSVEVLDCALGVKLSTEKQFVLSVDIARVERSEDSRVSLMSGQEGKQEGTL